MRTESDAIAAIRARLALDAGEMSSWAWNIDRGEVHGDPLLARFFGMDAEAESWHIDDVFGSIHPEDEPRVRDELKAAIHGDEDLKTSFRVCRSGRKPECIWLGARGRVVTRSGDGAAIEMIGVNWDITERVEQEQRLAMLASEMDHRVKNAFAVMRALIRLAGKAADDTESLARTLEMQTKAMADAHMISAGIGRENHEPEAQVPVADLLKTALRPWLHAEPGGCGRGADVQLDADPSITLEPASISAVAMLAYELATNATKHGPLGERGGALTVTLQPDEGEDVLLRWEEDVTGAPFAERAEAEAEAGTSAGFGSVLIQHCAATLGAQIKRRMTPSGLLFEIRFPASRG